MAQEPTGSAGGRQAGPRRTPHMAIWTPIGIALGAALGAATDNLGLWMGVGIALGVAIGAGLDAAAAKKEAEKK